MHESDPVIEDWLRREFGDAMLDSAESPPPLSLLTLAAQRRDRHDFPDEVLRAWHRLLASERRSVYQSEFSFIEQTRKQGWTWQQLADTLGLKDAHIAETRREQLAVDLQQQHPGNFPKPWTG